MKKIFLLILIVMLTSCHIRNTEFKKVIFDLAYDNSVLKVCEIEKNSKILKPANPYREGYVFKGWYAIIDGNEHLWDFDAENVTNNMTLYAKWRNINNTTGKFLDLNTAYKNNYLTKTDIMYISYYNSEIVYGCDDEYNGNNIYEISFAPKYEITDLDDKTKNDILKNYAVEFQLNVDNISILKYLGSYNDCYVLQILGSGNAIDGMILYQIDNIVIRTYQCSISVFVYQF